VIVGVIGFPLVFETQPRPIPLDIPIEIPRRDGAPALVMPAARRAATPGASGVVASRDDIVTEAKGDAGKEVPAPAASNPAPAAPVAAAAPAKPAPAPAPAEAPKKVVAEARPAAPAAAPAADAARAKALLEGSAPAKEKDTKDGGRFVVQVGAFADAAAARDTRAKVEKLGLKTYTQVVETGSGSRTRVRVGPFASRDEADKALAKTREAGISAVVLSL